MLDFSYAFFTCKFGSGNGCSGKLKRNRLDVFFMESLSVSRASHLARPCPAAHMQRIGLGRIWGYMGFVVRGLAKSNGRAFTWDVSFFFGEMT